MDLQLQLAVICSLVSFCLAHYGSYHHTNPQPGEPCTPSYTAPCGKRELMGESETEVLTQADGFRGPNVCRSVKVYGVPTYSYHYRMRRVRCRDSWGYPRPCGNRLYCRSTGVCNGTVQVKQKKSLGCCHGFTTTDVGQRVRTDTIRNEGCPVIVRDNVVQCLNDLGLTFFVDELTNLEDTFADELENNDSDIKVTIFAPTNEAFDDFGDIHSTIVIEGHIADGRIRSKRLSKGKVIATRADDVNLHVGTVKGRRKHKDRYFLNGVKISYADACKTQNGNGIVHVMDSFIPFSTNTTAEVLESQSDRFSTFNRLLEGAGIMRYLRKAQKSRTVFAPTNEAFDKLPSGAVECLLRRRNKLRSLVLIHIAAPAEYSSTLVERYRVPTFAWYRLIISSDNNTIFLTRDRIPIQEVDIPANNGVIHVLPDVIVPPEIDFEKLCPTVATTLPSTVPATTTVPSGPLATAIPVVETSGDGLLPVPLDEIVPPGGLAVGAQDI